MLSKELQEEYIQWLKDNGKAEYKLDLEVLLCLYGS